MRTKGHRIFVTLLQITQKVLEIEIMFANLNNYRLL